MRVRYNPFSEFLSGIDLVLRKSLPVLVTIGVITVVLPGTVAFGQEAARSKAPVEMRREADARESTVNEADPRPWAKRILVLEDDPLRPAGRLSTMARLEPNDPAVSDWDSRFDIPGIDGYINAVAVSGTYTYVAGDFVTAGGTIVNHIARWDGATWQALDLGLDGTVHALHVDGTDIYVGGSFRHAGALEVNCVAVWDEVSESWSALSGGVSGREPYTSVYAFGQWPSGLLVAAGYFKTAGGVSSPNVARWDGASWAAVGSGISGPVYTIETVGSDMYFGGHFSQAGGASANNVALRSSSVWSGLGVGVSGPVYGLSFDSGILYAGGDFAMAGVTAVGNVASWNGASWGGVGSGVDGPVYALHHDGSTLYVGGKFNTAGGSPASSIASYQSAWSALGSGVVGESVYAGVFSIVDGVAPGELLVGGGFTQAGSARASRIASWNGTGWQGLTSGEKLGLDGPVRALLSSGTTVYAGGYFQSSGSTDAARVASWNVATESWSPIGVGLGAGAVFALAADASDLYAGGSFHETGDGTVVNRIARYQSGSGWSEMDGGVTSDQPHPFVYALAAQSGTVYVGGSFTQAGTIDAPGIAAWNASSGWSEMDGGVTGGAVLALAVEPDGDVFVGGNFTGAGGQFIPYLAKWNASTGWSAVGVGVDGPVHALVVSGGSVYVGGAFTTAGGLAASRVARYEDDVGWSTVGSGFNGDAVSSLAHDGTNLYAGGSFTTAQGTVVNGVSRYDGGSWTALGTGADGTVSAVAAIPGSLFAGGYFNNVDGKPSYHFGIWIEEVSVAFLPLFATVFLEGAYAGPDSMSVGTVYRDSLPEVHPYDNPFFNGWAAEYDVPSSPTVLPEETIDWLIVSLRTGTGAGTEVGRNVALLFEDGTVRNLDGSSPFLFEGVASGSYRIVVMHRNHLPVMTSDPVSLGGAPAFIDFSSGTVAYSFDGPPMVQLADGTYAMFAGNGTPDDFVDSLDLGLHLLATAAGKAGYEPGDYNMDGLVQGIDAALYLKNSAADAKSQVPN